MSGDSVKDPILKARKLEDQKLKDRKPEDIPPHELAIIRQEWELMDAVADGTFKGDWLPIDFTKTLPAELLALAPKLTDEEKKEFAERVAHRRAKRAALKQWLAERDNGSHPVK